MWLQYNLRDTILDRNVMNEYQNKNDNQNH